MNALMRDADPKLLCGFSTLLESDLSKTMLFCLAKSIAPYRFAMEKAMNSG